MTHDLFGILLNFAFLAALAMLVKNERRLKRWLLKHPKRRRKTVVRVLCVPRHRQVGIVIERDIGFLRAKQQKLPLGGTRSRYRTKTMT